MSEKNVSNATDGVVEAAKDPFEGFIVESSHDKGEEGAPAQEQTASKEAEKASVAPDKEQGAEDNKKPAKKTVDDRIAEITAKRRQAEREAAESAKKVSDLEARLAALESKRASDSDQLTQPAEGAKQDPSAPDPSKFEYGEVDPRYVAALARYEAKQELAEERRKNDEARQADAAARAEQEIAQKLDLQIRRGLEKHDDFETALAALDDIGTPITAEAAQLLVESEYGADLLYYFGKNLAEAEEVAKKSPIEQARHIGKLEARFSAEADKATDKKPEAKVSKAPTPPETRVRGSNGQFRVSPDTTDFAAFDAAYN
jgi:hypothetical protein